MELAVHLSQIIFSDHLITLGSQISMVPPRLFSVPYKAADAMTPSLARRRKGMPGRVRRAVQLAARRCTCRSEL